MRGMRYGLKFFSFDAPGLEAAIAMVKREKRLTPKAIIPVDLFGLAADYPALEAIAERAVEVLRPGVREC